MNDPTRKHEFPVLINAAAGSDDRDEVGATIETQFADAGGTARVARVAAEDIRAWVEDELAKGCRTIVAGGGDGTISTVASALIDRDAALGVLPLGTLNHFAKDQGIPLELRAAVRAIVAGNQRRVDVGEVNGHIFINNSSLGLYPDMLHYRERHRDRLRIGKWLAAGLATVSVLTRDMHLDICLHVDGTRQECRTRFAFIGNNEYVTEGLDMGSRTTLQNGVLSLYTASKGSRLTILRLIARALFGHLHDSDDFSAQTATHIDIHVRRRRIAVAIDGETCKLQTPLHYRIRPGALRLLVPQSDATDKAQLP